MNRLYKLGDNFNNTWYMPVYRYNKEDSFAKVTVNTYLGRETAIKMLAPYKTRGAEVGIVEIVTTYTMKEIL